MLSSPLVDIILPTNRLSPFIAQTIDSVKAQTLQNWQLTIIGDGAPRPHLLDEFANDEPRIEVLHQGAKGTSAARNRGLRETSAPYVVFLDDDDLWEDCKLEIQVKALQKHPEYCATFSGGNYIDATGRPFGRPWPAAQEFSRTYLAGEAPLPRIVTLMFRREVCLAVGGFEEGMGTGQDLDFTLKVAQHGEMFAVDRPLIHYRRHDHNVSQAGSLAGRQAIKSMLRRHIARAQTRGDIAAMILLREYAKNARQLAAHESVTSLAFAVRNRDLRAVLNEVPWVASAPRTATQKVGRVIIERLRSGAQSRD